MLFFECTGEGWQNRASGGWGACRRIVAVADDRRASRQLELYRSGPVLAYDRDRPQDRDGQLLGLRFSRKDKWRNFFEAIEELSAAEFEALWRRWSPRATNRPSTRARRTIP